MVVFRSYHDDCGFDGLREGSNSTYTHNGENQLIKRDALTPNGGTTESVDYFIYESGQVVLQFHENNPTGDLTAGDLVHRYLWNPEQVDQLLADEQVSSLTSPGQVVWPLLNDQNSVTDLAIYEAGITAIANHRVYDAYDNLSGWMGSVGCAFGYTGKYSDPLTRLQFNTNRWYDPATCRWMSQDPLGLAAGPNVYRYAGDNPVNYTDPSGLFVITTGGSAGASSGGNPISIQGGGGSYNDLLYRPGETPLNIGIGPFRPGDYATQEIASLVESSDDDKKPDGSDEPLWIPHIELEPRFNPDTGFPELAPPDTNFDLGFFGPYGSGGVFGRFDRVGLDVTTLSCIDAILRGDVHYRPGYIDANGDIHFGSWDIIVSGRSDAAGVSGNIAISMGDILTGKVRIVNGKGSLVIEADEGNGFHAIGAIDGRGSGGVGIVVRGKSPGFDIGMGGGGLFGPRGGIGSIFGPYFEPPGNSIFGDNGVVPYQPPGSPPMPGVWVYIAGKGWFFGGWGYYGGGGNWGAGGGAGRQW